MRENIYLVGGHCCLPRNGMRENIEGFRPEWYFSTLYHCRDLPFWSETLNIYLVGGHCCLPRSYCQLWSQVMKKLWETGMVILSSLIGRNLRTVVWK